MKNILLLSSLVFSVALYGQETWEYRYPQEFFASAIHGIIATDTCIYTNGGARSGENPNVSGTFFAVYDLDGNLLTQNENFNPDRVLISTRNTFVQQEDKFWTYGYIIDSLGAAGLLSQWDNAGNVLQEIIIKNHFYPEETFIAPLDIKVISDTTLLLLSNIQAIDGENLGAGGQITLMDIMGNTLFQTVISDPIYSMFSTSIEADENYIYVGGALNNTNITNSNYDYRSFIVQLDYEGNIINSLYRPIWFLTNAINDLVETSDGGFIYSSGIGEEIEPINELRWDNTLVKVNADLEIEWETLLRGGSVIAPLNELERIIELEDGSGYVTAGLTWESEEHIDWLGCLAKVAPNGDSLWMRLFSYIPLTTLGEDGYTNWYHAFYDMDVAPDGGFILGGESRLNYIPDTAFYPPPIQQIYLVKTDEYGCLVPDCHLVSTEELPLDKPIRLKIHPNPTSEELYVYAGDLVGIEQPKIRIFNLQGQLVQEFDVQTSHTTYITHVGHLPSGIYTVCLFERGNILEQTKLVVD